MAETIESFVAKLQDEGVQAGKQAAEQIRAEAEKKAEAILAEAKQQAEKAVRTAQAEAKAALERVRTEMQLASRDTLLRLREALNRALAALLAAATKERLADPEFLGPLLREIVLLYAKADAQGGAIEINVPEPMREQLAKRVLGELAQAAQQPQGAKVDLKGELAEEGFEYTAAGGTVEVTTDSVVATLKAMVSPKLAELLERAAAEGGPGETQKG